MQARKWSIHLFLTALLVSFSVLVGGWAAPAPAQAASVGKAPIIKTLSKPALKALKAATPKITGTAKVGKTLTANRGTWTSGTKFKYQWYRSGKAIKNATKATYKIQAADAGKTLKVKVTGSKTGYKTIAKTSAAKKIPAAKKATSSKKSSAVRPGAFCSTKGKVGYTVKGTKMVCKTKSGDPRLRWRAA